MLSQFRTYKLAVEFHHTVRGESFPSYLKEQVLRTFQFYLVQFSG